MNADQLKKCYERLNAARQAARDGDKIARKDKEKIMSEIRAIERQGAKEGRIYTALSSGDTVRVEMKEVDSKKSQQEEYLRKFDNDVVVQIGGRQQTMREFNRRRLFGK